MAKQMNLNISLAISALSALLLTNVGIAAEELAPAQATQQEPAEKTPNWKEDTLTGDWGGLRKSLFEKGLDIGLTHKSDFWSNVSGGIQTGSAWMGHTEVRTSLDLEKMLGWSGTSAYVHFHSDLGSKFNEKYVGGFMGIDNIEVATNTAQFFQAWLQKSLMNDHLSIKAGLYALDSEFYVTDTSGVFIEPPYGMSNEIAQTGKNGPPIFPVGALAIRVKATSSDDRFYAMAAVMDGVPGDPKDPRGTHILLKDGDGTLSALEIGYTPKTEGKPDEESEIFHKTAIGIWGYSYKLDDLDSSMSKKHRSQGIYVLTEHTLYVEPGHPSQGLSGFARFGTASDQVNQSDWTGSLGLRYHGLIDGRDDDIAGLAVTVNHASDHYQQLNNSESTETDWELTYRAQINGWLALQPDVQYIVHPNMDKTIDDAFILGLRAEVQF